ncbi:cysteine desulfurase/selenocysteine lyase [Clostridium acetobutylicum]|jgi:cysteine desulfurase/selenocysteine lyase|uniref:cysteine desulfurase n=1 Tax=Clostridium acetobutylicum (strain ATCC 824 / DSM 792 / JCM 1419 / IAM 19013 / LMG 5710 / NBRC 13948 / NRRL B-527 / VKM B-1787 / 2291 / W) TaxID=272562 RepID=Q97E25_CLOAB|nr:MULTISPECIES: SufS family cysteine desulfurase [Clostridium]AAK81225.1 Selenocysteine lyase, NifS family [Clostridium acetobutylicum ATCC 824]ADZ22330.1 Selenocysteine lyase, NifS family [Clostridium acetobutylicum EA 2018]AEI34684.1 selenocysteine lyase [Clostridium acetobutylicum DSM 1731]AWV81107.1 cysteine desulfurase [Clostridium acetobutylicum]MBC2395692.1 cysteine desulfurase [Clostridium acetobutylicum]
MNNKYIKDFPTLDQEFNGHKFVYLDNAATTQKPLSVINAVNDYYRKSNANPHRGAYALSVKATDLYEGARDVVKDFINANKSKEIVFVRNATEALNLVAYSYGLNFINAGDEIVISIAEHHSNLVPWQQVAKAKGAVLKYLYLNEDGIIPHEEFESKITSKTKIVSVTHVSNVLGTINPVNDIIKKAHSVGAIAILDAAQSIPHMEVDVKALDADFVVFSGHKMLAPMGIGVLYGKEALLEKMPPFMFGGDMIEYVWEQKTTFAEVPHKFEGGTQNVGGAVGLTAAIEYLNKVGLDKVYAIEKELTAYALERLSELPYVKVYGTKDASKKAGVISFNVDDVHPHDVATILDSYGVAIRTGHHCANPLMRYMDVNATCRASFYFYNTREDVDALVEGLKNTRKWLGYGS